VSDTEERPAADPEEIGAPDPDSADQAEVAVAEAPQADGAVADVARAEGARAEGARADGAVAEGAPAEGAVADGAPADGAPAGGTPAGGTPAGAAVARAGGPPRARRRAVLGWTAATIGIAGVAWLLTSLITLWTSYPTLTVAKWQMVTYGPRSAQIRFSVHNSGTGAAAGCTAHVQLGNGQIVSASSPTINVGGTVQLYLGYWEKHRPQTHPAYAWATCGGARSPYERVATTTDIGLITGHVQVTPGPTVTSLSFEEHNLGSQEAYSCRAVTRFPGRNPAPYGNAPSDIRSGATSTFTIRYPSSLGHPAVLWAQCYDPPASDGAVISTKAYLRHLFRSR
jgi:hypothetical protein